MEMEKKIDDEKNEDEINLLDYLIALTKRKNRHHHLIHCDNHSHYKLYHETIYKAETSILPPCLCHPWICPSFRSLCRLHDKQHLGIVSWVVLPSAFISWRMLVCQ